MYRIRRALPRGGALLLPLLLPLLLVVALEARAFSLDVPSGVYQLDKGHGYITLTYSHLGFSTPELALTRFDAVANLDAELPGNSSLEVTIDPASIDSRVPEFDKKLRGAEFFDVAAFPTITFLATRIEMIDTDRARVTGDLTLKGQTRPVVLDAKINKAGLHPIHQVAAVGLDASTTLIRSEWDLGAYAPAVGDTVQVRISLELLHQPPAAPAAQTSTEVLP